MLWTTSLFNLTLVGADLLPCIMQGLFLICTKLFDYSSKLPYGLRPPGTELDSPL